MLLLFTTVNYIKLLKKKKKNTQKNRHTRKQCGFQNFIMSRWTIQ